MRIEHGSQKFPALAVVGMNGRPAGPGRDEKSVILFPDPIPRSDFVIHFPASEVRIWSNSQILTLLAGIDQKIGSGNGIWRSERRGMGERGRDPILSTQRFAGGRDRIVSTQRIS